MNKTKFSEQQINDLVEMISRTRHIYFTKTSSSVYVRADDVWKFLHDLAVQIETTHGHDLSMSYLLANITAYSDYEDTKLDAVNFGD